MLPRGYDSKLAVRMPYPHGHVLYPPTGEVFHDPDTWEIAAETHFEPVKSVDEALAAAMAAKTAQDAARIEAELAAEKAAIEAAKAAEAAEVEKGKSK